MKNFKGWRCIRKLVNFWRVGNAFLMALDALTKVAFTQFQSYTSLAGFFPVAQQGFWMLQRLKDLIRPWSLECLQAKKYLKSFIEVKSWVKRICKDIKIGTKILGFTMNFSNQEISSLGLKMDCLRDWFMEGWWRKLQKEKNHGPGHIRKEILIIQRNLQNILR